jgi:hypothetical protein
MFYAPRALLDVYALGQQRQANFKDFKRFEDFSGLVDQKNVVFNSFLCKLGLFWHSWAFKTLASLAFYTDPLMPKRPNLHTNSLNKLLLKFRKRTTAWCSLYSY